jgi:hypothetical protein
MSTVIRLPVQHRQAPHCASCKAELPNLNGLIVTLGFDDVGDYEVLGMTMHIRCKCGKEWDLRKAANR